MSRLQLDTTNLTRRDVILIAISAIVIVGVIVGLIIFFTGRSGPKVVNTPPPVATPTLIVLAGTATPSPEPPTVPATVGPTATLEPYQYTIQKNDTLLFILQQFGYRDLSIIPEVVQLNHMASADILPPPGSVLKIPRQTPTPGPSLTPTPQGATAGPTQDYTGCSPDHRCVSPDGRYWVHIVVSGDTILGIAYFYNSRPDDIFKANAITANTPLKIGQRLNIPILVTLTPTLTPTGGPDSTGTPTPTYAAPSLLAPSNGSSVPRGQPVILEWVASHPLDSGESYLVILHNTASGAETRYTTRSNSFQLPSELQPGLTSGPIAFEWQVVIIQGSATNVPPISGADPPWTFTWG